MAGNNAALTLSIFGHDQSASSTLQSVSQSAARTDDSVAKLGKQLKGALAVGAIVAFGKESVAAFAEAEQSQLKLQEAFAKFPALADSSIEKITAIAEARAQSTKFDDDATKAAAANLAQFKLTGTQIEQLLPLVQDYAARTGTDLPEAASKLGKAVLGQTRSLKEVGINYKSTGDQATDYGNIVQLLGEKVGGFAESQGATASGRLEILTNNFGELKEAVGEAILPLAGGLVQATGAALSVITPLASAVGSVIGFIGGLPGPVKAAATALGLLAALKMLGVFSAIRLGAGSVLSPLASMRMQLAATADVAALNGSRFPRMSAGLTVLGRSAGVAGRGLMSAFGGPIGLAIAGVVTAISLFSSANQDAQAEAEETRARMEDLAGTLDKVTGAFTGASVAKLAEQLAGSDEQLRAVGTSAGELASIITNTGKDGGAAMRQLKSDIVAATNIKFDSIKLPTELDTFGRMLDRAKVSSTEWQNAIVRGGAELDAVRGKFSAAGEDMGKVSEAEAFYREELLKRSPALKTVVTAENEAAGSVDQTTAAFKRLTDAAATEIKFDPTKLNEGLTAAAAKGVDTRTALEGLGITGPKADKVLSILGDTAATTAASIDQTTTSTSALADEQLAAESAAKDYAAANDAAGAAVDRAQEALDAAKDKLTPFGEASQVAGDRQSRLADETNRVSDALDRQSGRTVTIEEANYKASEAVDSLASAFGLGTDQAERLGASVLDGAGKIDTSTESGRKLYDQTYKVRDAMAAQAAAAYDAAVRGGDLAGAQDKAAAAAQGTYDAFITSQTAILGSKDAAEKLAKAYGLVPKTVATAVKADTDQANAKLADVNKKAADLEKKQAVKRVTANKEQYDATLQSIAMTGIPGKTVPVGADTGQADRDVQAWRIRQSAALVVRVVTSAITLGGGGVSGGLVGNIAGYANGGVIPGIAPDPKKDNLLALVDGKTPIAVQSEEFIVNRRQTKKHRGLLEAINGGIAGFAGGGLTSAGALMGIAPRDVGDREGRISGSLSDLAGAVRDLRGAATDLRGKSNDAAGQLADSRRDRRETLAKGRQSVRDADAKADDRNAAAAKSLTEAQRKLADAQSRTTKTAADRLAKEKAIEAATRKVADAESRVAQVRKAGEASVKKASDAAVRANRAADAKVRADSRAATAADRLADAAKRRADAADKELKATARMRMALGQLGRQYDTITARLAKSSEKLSGLKDDRSQLAGSIAGSISGFGGGITGFADQRTSVSSIVAGQKYNVGKVKAFQSNLAKLKKLGLSGSQLSQIASGGEDGMRTAAALASGSKSDIAQLNSYERQINTSARASGSSVAGAVYDKRITAAERENAALRRQQAVTDRQIRDLAKTLDQGFTVSLDPTGVARINRKGEALLKKLGA